MVFLTVSWTRRFIEIFHVDCEKNSVKTKSVASNFRTEPNGSFRWNTPIPLEEIDLDFEHSSEQRNDVIN